MKTKNDEEKEKKDQNDYIMWEKEGKRKQKKKEKEREKENFAMLVTCSSRVHNMVLAQAQHHERRGDTGIDLIPIPALYFQHQPASNQSDCQKVNIRNRI